MTKSDSLKSYATFQPIFPYFILSCTTAWRKARVNRQALKASCGQASKTLWSILAKVARIFNFRPSGGSVTTFKDFCNMPMGKRSVGSVVIQSLKSLWGAFMSSIFFSNIFNQLTNKWQFCRRTQWPERVPWSMSSSAFGPWP